MLRSRFLPAKDLLRMLQSIISHHLKKSLLTQFHFRHAAIAIILATHNLCPFVRTFNDQKVRGWFGVADLIRLKLNQKEINFIRRIKIQPLDSLPMLITNITCNPYDCFSANPSRVSDTLAKMIVICTL